MWSRLLNPPKRRPINTVDRGQIGHDYLAHLKLPPFGGKLMDPPIVVFGIAKSQVYMKEPSWEGI